MRQELITPTEVRFSEASHANLNFVQGAVLAGLEGMVVGSVLAKSLNKLGDTFRGKRQSSNEV